VRHARADVKHARKRVRKEIRRARESVGNRAWLTRAIAAWRSDTRRLRHARELLAAAR